jgi:hypothetical protein
MYPDGVAHTVGYLTTVDASGTQRVVNPAAGGHSLDQRLLIDDGEIIGLAVTDGSGQTNAEDTLLYYQGAQKAGLFNWATAGDGMTAGRLGDIVDLGDRYAVTFLTSDRDPGPMSSPLSDADRDAIAGPDRVGLILVDKAGMPSETTGQPCLDLRPGDGSHFSYLKTAPYGGNLLLAWKEVANREAEPGGRLVNGVWEQTEYDARYKHCAVGNGFSGGRYFTMVADRLGERARRAHQSRHADAQRIDHHVHWRIGGDHAGHRVLSGRT